MKKNIQEGKFDSECRESNKSLQNILWTLQKPQDWTKLSYGKKIENVQTSAASWKKNTQQEKVQLLTIRQENIDWHTINSIQKKKHIWKLYTGMDIK